MDRFIDSFKGLCYRLDHKFWAKRNFGQKNFPCLVQNIRNLEKTIRNLDFKLYLLTLDYVRFHTE